MTKLHGQELCVLGLGPVSLATYGYGYGCGQNGCGTATGVDRTAAGTATGVDRTATGTGVVRLKERAYFDIRLRE